MVKAPLYWGGMILSSNMDDVYSYEDWLLATMRNRLKKYRKRWGFFVGMMTIARKKKYRHEDRHPVPEDPLIYFDDDVIAFADVLSLKGYKLKILEFEVMKYYRRKGYYPC